MNNDPITNPYGNDQVEMADPDGALNNTADRARSEFNESALAKNKSDQ